VKHYATPDFWAGYRNLPSHIREVADKNFTLLKMDPRHPSLHFKKIGKIWSVRIGLFHRALAVKADDGFLWFWIGSHSEYDKLVG
jgi:hypothetical protein